MYLVEVLVKQDKGGKQHLEIYHTHNSTTVEDIKDLVKETSKVEVLEVEKRSREG